MDKALDANEVIKLAKSTKKTIMFTYDELASLSNNQIEKLLNKTNILLFYPTISDQMGHWTALFKRKNTYEFYDPYGYFPNDIKTIRKLNKRLLLFIQYLIDKNKKVEFNNYKHQAKSPFISTCGRHTGLRLKNYNIPLDQYNKIMKKISKKLNLSLDELIYYLTEPLISQ